MRRGRIWLLALLGVVGLIQLVPYGRERTPPAGTTEPDWDAPRTRELFFRVCKDCHSNETEWPWYASVAPASWLVRWDVDEGREHLDVSDWGRSAKQHGDDAAEEVREGEMPLWYYLLFHPEARLSDAERLEFAAGLERTFGAKDAGGKGDHSPGESRH